MLFAVSVSVQAQQPEKIPRIGYIARRAAPTVGAPDAGANAFREGLRDLGYIEGKNIFIEYRYAEEKQERISSLVGEIIQLNVDVLVSPSLPIIRAAKQATKTIPIVMIANADPVATGMIDSLARPGGNVTGLARLTRDLGGKRLQLLVEAVPRITRVGILWDANAPGPAISFKEYETAARSLKIPFQSLEVRGSSDDLTGAFQAADKEKTNALVVVTSTTLLRQQKRISDLAIKHRLASMHESSGWVEAGGLMSYSTNDLEIFRRAAFYVDKILKGIKPADLPVEQPMKFEFVANLKTAKQIGLTIPQRVLARADRVIK
jgi:putative ABC transport system substrate-binding protein